jgi:protein subunit release factor B
LLELYFLGMVTVFGWQLTVAIRRNGLKSVLFRIHATHAALHSLAASTGAFLWRRFSRFRAHGERREELHNVSAAAFSADDFCGIAVD